ncbi:MAG: hypothetical protein FJ220_06465 [Kiritimatiellaceae bacterium]|nr:hypothetical protein [Kiritimatiellaceae bacterium]
MKSTIPLHLIAGALGVGKTTAIRQFVATSQEFTAVLVNDFGETGYDASFIAEAGGANRIRVENIPGGCLCCTTAARMLPALKMLCAKPNVKRIIVEPSGIALMAPLLKMLHGAAAECGFELAPVIVLFDPAITRKAALEAVPYWRQFVDCADIIVANRCDLASPQAIDQFFRCLENWNPPKLKVLRTSFGKLPPEIFDLRTQASAPPVSDAHHQDLPYAGLFRSEAIFRLDALNRLLQEIEPSLQRFKGVFRTNEGFYRLEIASGAIQQTSATAATQSFAEWIGGSAAIADRLDACRSKG